MPLKLDTDTTFTVCLKSDESKPAESRPEFIVRVQTVVDQRRLSQLIDQWSDPSHFEKSEQVYDEAVEALKGLIVDWKNMGQPFDVNGFSELLTYLEVRELINRVLHGQYLTEAEKKSSE